MSLSFSPPIGNLFLCANIGCILGGSLVSPGGPRGGIPVLVTGEALLFPLFVNHHNLNLSLKNIPRATITINNIKIIIHILPNPELFIPMQHIWLFEHDSLDSS